MGLRSCLSYAQTREPQKGWLNLSRKKKRRPPPSKDTPCVLTWFSTFPNHKNMASWLYRVVDKLGRAMGRRKRAQDDVEGRGVERRQGNNRRMRNSLHRRGRRAAN